MSDFPLTEQECLDWLRQKGDDWEDRMNEIERQQKVAGYQKKIFFIRVIFGILLVVLIIVGFATGGISIN